MPKVPCAPVKPPEVVVFQMVWDDVSGCMSPVICNMQLTKCAEHMIVCFTVTILSHSDFSIPFRLSIKMKMQIHTHWEMCTLM